MPTPENEISFAEALSQFESQTHKAEPGKQIEASVISLTPDSAILDIGFKSEGILPLTAFRQPPQPGETFLVSVKGRDPEGYYQLSLGKIARPADWPALEKAFNEKSTIVGTVTAVIKGGLSVDVGVRAFLPASRSGTRDAAELEKLVGQEIRCRITKLDTTDEDVVVDRRIIAEEEERATKEQRYQELKEGSNVRGTVRSLTDYGAFVDIGGVDALLHVGEISWTRIAKPSDILNVGDEVEARIIKIDPGKHRISISLKQLQPHPWDTVPTAYKIGDRVRGPITRTTDFGAFVELAPGIEGLIHISEMSWQKKLKRPEDVVKVGETVEAIVLGINAPERRLSLGLKQTLGDPWKDIAEKYPVGSAIEGPITSIQKFGAFVQIAEGIEGMIHVSEISAEKRINHPQDVLKLGQVVRAQILAIDPEKRTIRLSMKQLIPTGIDEYIAEHKPGDTVSGRLVEITGQQARVELGEGIQAACPLKVQSTKETSSQSTTSSAKPDLSSLGNMLQARWKGTTKAESKPQPLAAGQIRQFRITKLDAATKKIEVDLA
ncbi:MAG TPA: 30S ribosomal protein S1 [Terriglobales bacterium]|nr:30S ribosomal protein S1 [Terriglobales bacterium]